MSAASPPIPALPDPPPDEQRCTHLTMGGARCTQRRETGSTACRYHGGAEERRRKQALRLADLVEPAVATLARVMTSTTARDSDKIRAAENVLDRTGFPRRAEVQADDAREMLLARLLALRDAHTPAPQAPLTINRIGEETDDREPYPDEDDDPPRDSGDYGDDGLG